MRQRKLDWSKLAAWLGVIALGLNALVPVHLAFDLAEALEPAHHAPGEAVGLDRQIIALLCGHEADHHHAHHHGKEGGAPRCPVCAAAASLAALALPTVAALPLPAAAAVRLADPTILAATPTIAAAAYRSRAPPTA